MSKIMVLKPKISEKAYYLSEKHNTFMFVVPKLASKLAIKAAVEQQYSVTVTELNTAKMLGKKKRTVRRGGRQVEGQRSDTKRAYVTLKSGDSLPFFMSEQETAAQPEPKKRSRKEVK